jgi:hypothetical protein
MPRKKLNGRVKLILAIVGGVATVIALLAAGIRHEVRTENRITTVEVRTRANEDACSTRYETLHEGQQKFDQRQQVMQEDIKKILEKI